MKKLWDMGKINYLSWKLGKLTEKLERRTIIKELESKIAELEGVIK